MEKFDKKKFDSHKIDGEYNFVLENNFLVRQMENIASQEYTEEIQDPIKPFTKVTVYYMSTCMPKVTGERFYLIPIGKWQYFDENGTLTKETNWDAAYKLTINDLAEKVMELEGIDIMKRQRDVDVLRSDISIPMYIVIFPVGPEKPYSIYNLVINGITGEVLEKTESGTKK